MAFDSLRFVLPAARRWRSDSGLPKGPTSAEDWVIVSLGCGPIDCCLPSSAPRHRHRDVLGSGIAHPTAARSTGRSPSGPHRSTVARLVVELDLGPHRERRPQTAALHLT